MIEIETFEKELTDEVVNLILNIQRDEFNVPIKAEDQPDLFEINEFYRKDGGEFWVAFINKELVGTISLKIFDKENKEGAIRKVFVKKEFRGKKYGVAYSLINTLVDYCYKNKIDLLYLGTVDKYKAAHRFYEKNNFTKIDKKMVPHKFPFFSVDNVFYKRCLIKELKN